MAPAPLTEILNLLIYSLLFSLKREYIKHIITPRILKNKIIPIKIIFSILLNFLLMATITLPDIMAEKTIAIITKGRIGIINSGDFMARTITVRVRTTNTDIKIINFFFIVL